LVALGLSNQWNLIGHNAGTLNVDPDGVGIGFFSGILNFSNVQNLSGNLGADQFFVRANATIDGKIDAGDGDDQLSYGYAVPMRINVQTGAATGTGGIVNFESFVGGTSNKDVVIGDNDTNFWDIFGHNSVFVDHRYFVGFENLTGG